MHVGRNRTQQRAGHVHIAREGSSVCGRHTDVPLGMCACACTSEAVTVCVGGGGMPMCRLVCVPVHLPARRCDGVPSEPMARGQHRYPSPHVGPQGPLQQMACAYASALSWGARCVGGMPMCRLVCVPVHVPSELMARGRQRCTWAAIVRSSVRAMCI